MKYGKKVVALLMCMILAMSMLAGCQSKEGSENSSGANPTAPANDPKTSEESASEAKENTGKAAKIGVLVSDATSAEALAFRSYYTGYIQNHYAVEFVYSDELQDASGEKAAIETFITNNCKAVISFSSFDRAAQLEQCSDAGVYYAVATGTLTDEEYEEHKANEHYIGAIGPSLDVEFETGYEMAKYYLDQGMKNFAIFGGAVPYYTDMHIYRVAGMLQAMVDASGADYKGADNAGAIIGQIYADGEITTGTIGDIVISGYVGGYDMDEAWFAKCAEMVQADGVEVLLAVGNGSDFFGTATAGTEVKIGSVDAYTQAFGEAMENGMLDYLAGKFSASIGPIFMATLSALEGEPIRDPDGNALALGQGYWVAADYGQFEQFYDLDSSTDSPAYDKAMLDQLLGADYDAFAEFVNSYTFEDIQAMK